MTDPPLLLDTGPLVALLNKQDNFHQQAVGLFARMKVSFITCESVITEASFILRNCPGASEEVMKLGQKGFYKIPWQIQDHFKELANYIYKYQNQPISLADACLISMAETYDQPCIITFDSDFEIYRWRGKKKFEIIK